MTEYGGGRTEGSAGRRGRQLGRLPRYGEGRAGLVAAELLPRGLGLLGGVTPGAEGVGGEGRGEGAGGGAQREAGPRGHGAAAAAAAHRARLVVASLQTAAMVTWKNVQVTHQISKYLDKVKSPEEIKFVLRIGNVLTLSVSSATVLSHFSESSHST